MKKTLIGILTLSASMVLASCGGLNPSSISSNPASSDPSVSESGLVPDTSKEAGTSEATSEPTPVDLPTIEEIYTELAKANATFTVPDYSQGYIVDKDTYVVNYIDEEKGDFAYGIAKVPGKGVAEFYADAEGLSDVHFFTAGDVNVLDNYAWSPYDIQKVIPAEAWVENETKPGNYVLEGAAEYGEAILEIAGYDPELYLEDLDSIKLTVSEDALTFKISFDDEEEPWDDSVIISDIGTTTVEGWDTVIAELDAYVQEDWGAMDAMYLDLGGWSDDETGLSDLIPFEVVGNNYTSVSYSRNLVIENANPTQGLDAVLEGLKEAGWSDSIVYADLAASNGIDILEYYISELEALQIAVEFISAETFETEYPTYAPFYPNGAIDITYLTKYTYPYEGFSIANETITKITADASGEEPVKFPAFVEVEGAKIELQDLTGSENSYYGGNWKSYIDYLIANEISEEEIKAAYGFSYLEGDVFDAFVNVTLTFESAADRDAYFGGTYDALVGTAGIIDPAKPVEPETSGESSEEVPSSEVTSEEAPVSEENSGALPHSLKNGSEENSEAEPVSEELSSGEPVSEPVSEELSEELSEETSEEEPAESLYFTLLSKDNLSIVYAETFENKGEDEEVIYGIRLQIVRFASVNARTAFSVLNSMNS